MSARALAVLVVLLVVLGGGALLYQRQQATERPQNAALLGRPLFKDLRAADIAAIHIVEPKSSLTVEQKDEGWVIRERDAFPADVAKVREFVVKMLELKVGQSAPLGEKDRARLNLDSSGTQVQLNGQGGKTLATLVVGKKYFKREVENPDKAPADGRFVAVPSETGIAYIVSDPLLQASTKSADWIDRTSFQVEKVKTLELRMPDGSGWKIERNGDNPDWKLAGARPGEKLDIGRANSASYSLSLLELADVAPMDARQNEAMTGLDKPTLINATTLDGLAYVVRVGKPEGDNYYVTFSSSGTLVDQPRGKEDEERMKKLKARLPREKHLADYVLLIPKSKLDDTLKPRVELLEKKPESRKK
jgi:hypothetical protein